MTDAAVRADVPFTGVITPETELFMMGLSDRNNPQLYYWACYSISTQLIVFGAGLLGNGIDGIIDADLRPIYFTYSSIGMILNAYSDIQGQNRIGSVGLSQSMLIVSNSATSLGLSTADPHMNINDRLLYGVRYSLTVTAGIIPCSPNTGQFQGICSGFNVPLVLTPNLIDRLEGITIPGLGIDISQYSARDQRFSTYGYLAQNLNGMYVNFFPLEYRRVENCSLSSGISGYIPNTMIIAQCYLSPDSVFGSSEICATRGGPSNYDDCLEVGFNYYYALSECGQSYLFSNMLNIPTTVETSRGSCATESQGDCRWNGSVFECVEIPVEVPQARTIEPLPLPKRIDPQTNNGGLLVGLSIAVIVIIIVIVTLIILIVSFKRD